MRFSLGVDVGGTFTDLIVRGMDAESYLGPMQIAFGSNIASFLGDSSRTSFHIDLPTRNHSILLNDGLIVDAGTIVAADLT